MVPGREPTGRSDLGFSALRAFGEAQAVGDGVHGVVESFDQRVTAAAASVADPVASRDAPGGDGELGQDVEAEVVGVEAEPAREAARHLALDGRAVVLDVSKEGGLGRGEAAGGG